MIRLACLFWFLACFCIGCAAEHAEPCRSACGSTCVDLAADPANCGACGNVCEAGASCSAGRCRTSCAEPAPTDCGTGCVDVARDPLNCGACGTACDEGSVCSQASCQSQCSGAYADRCGQACVDLRSDPAHCGACGHACKGGEFCSGGECAHECGAYAPDECNGLCVDTRSDPRFCGGCASPCQDGELCVDGACGRQCSGSRSLECDQACVDPLSDPRFCGSCDVHCALDQVCNDGVCQDGCAAPTPSFCGGVCVDLEHDARACGSCAIACKAGAVCSQGSCGLECNADGETRCGDTCVKLDSDAAHCGECDHSCPSEQFCSDGACADSCGGDTPFECGSRCVSADQAQACGIQCFGDTPSLCGDGCVDLGRDAANCGSCDNACDAGQHCVESECVVSCPVGTPDVCGDACVDLAADAQHCGACTTKCALDQQCIEGSCTPICSAPSATPCDGSCVDTESDASNCGGCGVVCGDDQRCDDGACHSHVIDIVTGASHVCGLLSTREVGCFGSNNYEQLGDAELAVGGYGKTRVKGLAGAVAELDAGWWHSCALLDSGEVQCWGGNYYGELGRDPSLTTTSAAPFEIQGFASTPQHLVSGDYHACVLTEAGSVQCWGRPNEGQLGRMTSPGPSWQPDAVSGLPADIATLQCGAYHCCIRRAAPDASIYCWGRTDEGQLGNSPTAGYSLALAVSAVPAPADGIAIPASIAIGQMHSCAIGGDGDVYCWGTNYYGELGVSGALVGSLVQVEGLPAGRKAVAVFAGWYASCAKLDDGSLACWGYHLASGSDTSSAVPQVVLQRAASKVALGPQYGFALFSDGDVWSWGRRFELLGRDSQPAFEPKACCYDL